jgi:DNA invertase Pin-like site-specific DNA recombinase
VYVGQTWRDILVRFAQHCAKDSGCAYLRNAIQKYGKENFEIKTICMAFGQNDTDYWEGHFMDKFDSRNPDKGYNLKTAGSHGKHSQESKDKVSKANRKFEDAEYDEMVRLYSSGEMLLCEICDAYDCSDMVIYWALDRAGAKRVGHKHSSEREKTPFETDVVRLYKQNVKYEEITKQTGCNRQHIIRIAKRNDLLMRNPSKIKIDNYEEKIIEMYKGGSTYIEIVEIVGCGWDTITNIVKKAKIPLREPNHKAQRKAKKSAK